jgi:hypothetical protein
MLSKKYIEELVWEMIVVWIEAEANESALYDMVSTRGGFIICRHSEQLYEPILTIHNL